MVLFWNGPLGVEGLGGAARCTWKFKASGVYTIGTGLVFRDLGFGV